MKYPREENIFLINVQNIHLGGSLTLRLTYSWFSVVNYLYFQRNAKSKGGQDGAADGKTPGKHSCSFCGKSYPKPNRLRVHERLHTGEKPFACRGCGKAYRSKSSLLNHKKIGCVDKRKKGALEKMAQQVVVGVT